MLAPGILVLVAFLLGCGCQTRDPDVRGPSTPEERAQFVARVRWLENDPLGDNAAATRQRLRQWTIDVPDIRFQVCPDLIGRALGDHYPYSREINMQVVLSGAVLTLEHPGDARDDVAVYTAGVEGALRAYEGLLKSSADARLAALDDLLEKRRRGELSDHIAALADERCERSITRFVAAPIGAAAGLLMALIVGRWLGPARAGARAAVVLRRVALVCVTYYAIVGIALHFLEPEYDPRFFPMSHYAWGEFGWLMTTTFFALSLALFTVAVASRNAEPASRSTRTGLGLLVIGALFVGLAGVFRGFPLHDLASAVGLPSVAMAVLVLSWKRGTAVGWRPIGVAAILMAVGMLAALLSVILDVGMPGLQQRVFLSLLLLWISLVASGT